METAALLSSRYARSVVAGALLGRAAFRPFADLPPVDPQLGSWFRADAERAERAVPFPPIPASLYRAYLRTGRDDEYLKLSFGRRTDTGALAIGAWLEGGARFIDALIDALWQICEEASWNLPAINYGPAGGPRRALPDPADPWVDIFSSETASLLCWALHLNEAALDAVEPRIGERVRAEVTRRVIEPYLARTDYWWMGFERDPWVVINNWNPWCNANVLAATLLTEDRDEVRLRVVTRALASLDRFLDGYRDDGGCDEGTMYWMGAAGALWNALDLVATATGGRCTFWDTPRIGSMMHYPVLTHIDREWFVNFADGDARLRLPADLLYRAGNRLGDTELAALGCALFRWAGSAVRPGTYYSVFGLLRALECYDTMRRDAREAPYPGDAWLEGVQVFVARETPGSPRGLYVAAKGGHNGESHSHNDVGSFVLALDGEPILVDPGTETYTMQTFDPEGRWRLWTTRSSWHNLPEANGVEQRNGREYGTRSCACQRGAGGGSLSMDIAGAWPPEAGMLEWVRTISLERGPRPMVEVTDRFALRAPADRLAWSFLCRPEPAISPGSARLGAPSGSALQMLWDASKLDASVEAIPLADPRMAGIWGASLYRLRLRLSGACATGTVVFRFRRAS